jgi:hypothetical protein
LVDVSTKLITDIADISPNIESLHTLSADELLRRIGQFPYVPIYRLLLAKKYQDADEDQFREALRHAALQAPDRVSLYEFLHMAEDPMVELKPAGDVETAVEPARAPEAALPEPTNTAQADERKDRIDRPVDAQAESAEETPEIPAPKAQGSGSPLENKYLAADAGEEDPLHLEELVPEDESAEPDVELEWEKLRRLAAEYDPDGLSFRDEMLHTAAQQQVNLDEKHTFLEWLDILEGKKMESPWRTDPAPVDKIDEVSQLESQIDDYSASQIYEADIQREVADMEEEENEIQLDADVSKAVTALADDSITLHTDAVTETLAKLMLLQGKKSQSIAVYEQLRLKYPEKSDYFAAQIDAIKAR